MWGHITELITCAKFQNEILMGCDSTVDRNFHFPVDFLMAITTVQRYCAASDIACDPAANLSVETFLTCGEKY